MQIPGDAIVFNKEKGKYHAVVNVLGMPINRMDPPGRGSTMC